MRRCGDQRPGPALAVSSTPAAVADPLFRRPAFTVRPPSSCLLPSQIDALLAQLSKPLPLDVRPSARAPLAARAMERLKGLQRQGSYDGYQLKWTRARAWQWPQAAPDARQFLHRQQLRGALQRQESASMLPALILAPRASHAVLDMCELAEIRSRLNADHSPLTTHHSPLTTHHSPLTTHHLPLTTYHLPPAIRPLTTYHLPPTTDHRPPTTGHRSLTTEHQPPGTDH